MRRRYIVPALGCAAALILISCFGDSTGPKAHRVPVAFAPVFASAGAFSATVTFTRVRIHLTPVSGAAATLDTLVSFPSTDSTITVRLSVPITGSSEDFNLTLAMINAAGDTVYRGGPTRVTAALSLPSAPTQVPMRYSGTGSNAAAVRFAAPIPTLAYFGDTATFAAQALDSSGKPIAGTPIFYRVDARDTLLARVPADTLGRVVARSVRGRARVIAALITGQADTTALTVQPHAATIAVAGGNSQSQPAGAVLPQPVTFRVKAADSLGVAGVTVSFAAASGGGGVGASTATTDTAGYASVTWTLGAFVGTQTMTGTVTGLTPATASATATGPYIVLTVPSLVGVGATGLALVKLSQPAPSGGVTVTVTSDSTKYLTVSSPGTVAFAAGDTLHVITLNGVAAGVSVLRAMATGYGAGATTAAVTPNLIVLQQAVTVAVGQSASLGITITPAAPTGGLVVTLASTDTTKLKVTTSTVTIPAAQTAGGATIQGVATGTAAVVATATGYAPGGAAITIANAATTLALLSGGGQIATAGTTLPLPIVVKVSDALGNGVPGVAVTFAVATGGGSLGTPNSVTNALGQASTTWTLGTATGQQSITATSTGLTGSPLTILANPNGVIATTTVSPKPDTLTALTATVQLTAQAKDAGGGNLTGSFTWVSRTPAVATVSASGLVTAVANGSSYVVATEAGGTKDSALVVVQQRLASISVSPASKNIYLGASYTFSASGVDGLGKPMVTALTFTWSSTAPAVATVDTVGHAVGVGLGAAQIKATSGTITGVANVSILTPITRLVVAVDSSGSTKPDTATLASLGITRRYHAYAYDTLNALMSKLTFAWTSTNGSVAVMNTTAGDTASATSAANGVTTINATAQGFTSKPGAALTVAQALASIQLAAPATNPSATIAVTGTVGMVARGLDANSRYIAGGTFTYRSSTPTIATVDSVSGVVTGVAVGADTITATSGAITSNKLIVTVSSAPPKIISFGRDTVSVGRGSTAFIPILLSTPAANGLIVKLGRNPAAYAHWSTATVTVAAGASSTNATLVGDSAGTTTVSATDSSGLGYTGGTAIAKVTANMRLTSGSYALNATDVAKTQVLLSDPSPAGGTYITFKYSAAGVGSVSPDPAFIPAGQLAADVQITGLAAGSTSITPTAIGVNGAASSLTVYAPVLKSNTTLIRLGAGQYEPNDYVYTPTYTNLAVPVTITSSDTTRVSVTSPVTIPASSSYAYFTTSALAVGAATLTFTATGWTASSTVSVVSTTPYVGLCCGGTYNTTSPQANVTVYSEDSTRTGHYRLNSLVVHLRSSDTTVMQVLDTVVTINPGQYYTSAGRVIPAGLGGTAWIIATASGHRPDSTQFTVIPPKLNFNFTRSYLGTGQYDPNQYVYTPNSVKAPLIVTVSNSNPTSVTVPAVDTIPTSSYYRYFTVIGNAPGSATLMASATGYQPDTDAYVVTSPRLTACCNYTFNNFNPGGNVTVYTTDSLRGGHYRMSRLSVSVVSTDTTVIKVDSSVVTVDSGTYYNSRAHVTPMGVGTARIVFTAAGHVTLDTLTITVRTPKVNMSLSTNAAFPSLLGRRQHFDLNRNGFYVYTPDNRTSPLAVTITHKATVDSLTTTTPTISAGTYYAYLDAYGLAAGSDTLVVSAPGYLPDTVYLRVTTPKFTNSGMPGTAATTNPPIGITVYATDSVGNGHYTMDTVIVAAASSDTTVIRPAVKSFRIPKNTYYASTSVAIVGPGTASMTYSDSAGTGYGPTTTGTVTVTGPSFGISNGTPVLGMRQTGGPYSANVYTQNNVTAPLVVHLLSTSTRVVTVPDSITIPTGLNYAYFPITALDTLGTIQIQASATGYTTASTTVQVTQPKFVIYTSAQLNTTSPASNITIYATDANGTSRYTTEKVVVTLASSATSVATIDSATVTIPSGQYYVNTPKWSPHVVGTAQLSAKDTRAALYAYATATANVAVVQPSLNFGSTPGALGIGQYQDYAYVYAPDNATAPISVAFAHTGTARTGTFTNLTNTPITGVTINTSTYYTYFRMSGLARGTDTLTASAASPAHNSATIYTVVDSGRVDPLNGWPSTIKAGDSVLVTLYARDPNTNARTEVAATQFTLAPNANIVFHQTGAVVTSVTIPADAQYVQFYLKGVTAGTGSVTITSPNYKTYTNTVTVQ